MSANRLLAALPEREASRLLAEGEVVELAAGQVLYHSGQHIELVYFPMRVVISLMARLEAVSKSSIEVGLIGYEGMLGLSIALGSDCNLHDAIVQIGGTALQVPAATLRSEFQRGGALQLLLLRYTEIRLMQFAQLAACRSWHTIEQRLACWLLMMQDYSQLKQMPLKQALIAEMMGVRRASITEAARLLQGEGLIRYRRGSLTILNRMGLEHASCECYQYSSQECERLLPTSISDTFDNFLNL